MIISINNDDWIVSFIKLCRHYRLNAQLTELKQLVLIVINIEF